MGNAAIWWQPRGAAVPRKIDMGQRLEDLQERIVIEEAATEAYSGEERVVLQRARTRVRIVTGWSADWALAEEVRAMLSALHVGGRIAIAADDAMVFGGFVATPPQAGSGTWWIAANIFERYSASTPAIGIGGRVTLISPAPAMRQETVLLTAAPSSQLYPQIASTAARNDWTGHEWVFAREYRFYPILKRAIGDRDTQAFLHEHGRVWKLDFTLDEDMAALAVLARNPDQVFAAPTAYGSPSAPATVQSSDRPSPFAEALDPPVGVSDGEGTIRSALAWGSRGLVS